jgi:hypothetical protein
MNLPQPDNYIDIHTHDGVPADDAYIIEGHTPLAYIHGFLMKTIINS